MHALSNEMVRNAGPMVTL